MKNFKIAIIGPEASGKTTLARVLAKKFHGRATDEYARIYFAENHLAADHVLSVEEMRELMAGQAAAEEGEGLIFVDASTIHGPLYASMSTIGGRLWFQLGSVDPEVMDYATKARYDAFIICRPHAALEWVDDGMRAMPDIGNRREFAEACEDFVRTHYPRARIISVDAGSWEIREAQAIRGIKELKL